MNSIPTSEAVSAAVEVADGASEAFGAWSRTGPGHRRELLLSAAALLQKRSAQLIGTMVAETKVSTAWAQFNVRGGIGLLTEAASLTTQIGGETIPSDTPGCIAMTLRVPVGVVLGMAPWNAPLLLGLRALAAPLACGNTVLLKASEHCPASHSQIGELLLESGFPSGVVNVVKHSPSDAASVVEALIAHPGVRRINFTGSTKTGRIIGALAGRHLKPMLLELGGKAPLIVLDDADIDLAVSAAAFGSFMNHGQICMSTERIIVDRKVADRFSERLAAKAVALGETSVSPNSPLAGTLISSAAADQVQAHVDDARAKGASVLVPLRREGAKIFPVVVDGVTPQMTLYGEESFGPIASIVRVNDADEAVQIANDTQYGLAGAVFGRDIGRTLDVARRLDCGLCHINGPTVRSEPQLPFGGVKASGFGRFGGKAAIQEFTDLKTITIQTSPLALPF